MCIFVLDLALKAVYGMLSGVLLMKSASLRRKLGVDVYTFNIARQPHS